MNPTRLIYKLAFERRYKQLERYATHSHDLQQEQLNWLVSKAANTAFGKEYGFESMLEQVNATPKADYRSFADNVPLSNYDQQKSWIERMLHGEADILWPGECKWFAKSSGTTSDKSKYIPVTDDALKLTHYRGGTDCVVIYLRLNPDSKMMSGKGLILGGSFTNEQWGNGIHTGDLSATLIQNVTPAVNFIRTPSKKIALMNEWEAKMQALTQSTIPVNVTNLSGVPSWMMGVLKNVLKETGKNNICEVWPNLEVFFHGGIAFTPYREQYKQLIPSDKMHYLETYNASEGFFGIQSSWDSTDLQLIIDNKIFYEFIPMDEYEEGNSEMRAIPLSQVEIGRNYAMVITTPGLWRYIIGDTVRFTQRDPYKFYITGRTKAYINAFGEELMVSNADEALTKTCQETGATVKDYTAAPTFAKIDSSDNSQGSKGRHSWIIEFTKAPDDIDDFANRLDKHLQEVNSDYEAKRYKGIFLDRLELLVARQDLFDDWLKAKGKLGGQHKIPRLSNSREYFEDLLRINA